VHYTRRDEEVQIKKESPSKQQHTHPLKLGILLLTACIAGQNGRLRRVGVALQRLANVTGEVARAPLEDVPGIAVGIWHYAD